MEEKDSKSVQDHLAQITQGKSKTKKLVFDPRTQELVLVDAKSPKPAPDAVTADEPTRDGCFACRLTRQPWSISLKSRSVTCSVRRGTPAWSMVSHTGSTTGRSSTRIPRSLISRLLGASALVSRCVRMLRDLSTKKSSCCRFAAVSTPTGTPSWSCWWGPTRGVHPPAAHLS